jgi:hypothetical protein
LWLIFADEQHKSTIPEDMRRPYIDDRLLALLPLIPPSCLLVPLLATPFPTAKRWIQHFLGLREDELSVPPVGSQLLAYVLVALLGFAATNKLVPKIKQYTLRKGICGKDLGKRGTVTAGDEM